MLFQAGIEALPEGRWLALVARVERGQARTAGWRHVGRVVVRSGVLEATLTRAAAFLAPSWAAAPDGLSRFPGACVRFAVALPSGGAPVEVALARIIADPALRDDRRHGGPRPVHSAWPSAEHLAAPRGRRSA